jgi:hypothetical protein
MTRDYITLTTSLPHLPYFEQAARLPITERALSQRLSMLDETDALQLKHAVELLRWRHHPVAAQTEHIEKQYRAVVETTSNAALREYVDWRIGGRAAMAALRLKHLGHLTPPGKPWGAGRLVRLIQSSWSRPEVGLEALFPWLKEARVLLTKGDAISLERLQMAVVWQRLTRMGESNPIGLEYVAAYVFKWDILRRWIAYDPIQAKQRFQQLIQEVIGEHSLVHA